MCCTSGIAAERMSPLVLSLSLGLVAALADVLGGYLLVRTHWERRHLRYFVSLGAGFLISAALLEMLPESFALSPRAAPVLVVVGFCVIHLIAHTVTPHFHGDGHAHEDGAAHDLLPHRLGYSVVGGLAVHSLFDGVAIASGFSLSGWLGWIIFLAILLHKIPEGFTVASIMLASGQGRRSALTSTSVVAAATLVGALLINLRPGWGRTGLPLSAGVAIYVAATDLLPETNREPGFRMALMFFAGVALFFVLKSLGSGLIH